MICCKCFSNTFYCFKLIWTTNNICINLKFSDIKSRFPPVNKQLQFVFGIESCYQPFRIKSIVPDMGFKSVGIKNDWSASRYFFKTIGIQLRLVTTFVCINTCFLSFDNSKRQPIIAPQHIIHISDSGRICSKWHSENFIFKFTARA